MSSSQNQTRTRILAAALALLESSGGQEVRMQDIAKAAGVSRQAVYLHFKSRAELLIATTLYVDEIRHVDARMRRLLPQPCSRKRRVSLVLPPIAPCVLPKVFMKASRLMVK